MAAASLLPTPPALRRALIRLGENWRLDESFSANLVVPARAFSSTLLAAWPLEARPEDALRLLSKNIEANIHAHGQSFSPLINVTLASDVQALPVSASHSFAYDLARGGIFVPSDRIGQNQTKTLWVSSFPLDEQQIEEQRRLHAERKAEPPLPETLPEIREWNKNFFHTLTRAQADAGQSMEAQTALIGLLRQGQRLATATAAAIKTPVHSRAAKQEASAMRSSLVKQITNLALPETVRAALRQSLKTLPAANPAQPLFCTAPITAIPARIEARTEMGTAPLPKTNPVTRLSAVETTPDFIAPPSARAITPSLPARATAMLGIPAPLKPDMPPVRMIMDNEKQRHVQATDDVALPLQITGKRQAPSLVPAPVESPPPAPPANSNEKTATAQKTAAPHTARREAEKTTEATVSTVLEKSPAHELPVKAGETVETPKEEKTPPVKFLEDTVIPPAKPLARAPVKNDLPKTDKNPADTTLKDTAHVFSRNAKEAVKKDSVRNVMSELAHPLGCRCPICLVPQKGPVMPLQTRFGAIKTATLEGAAQPGFFTSIQKFTAGKEPVQRTPVPQRANNYG